MGRRLHTRLAGSGGGRLSSGICGCLPLCYHAAGWLGSPWTIPGPARFFRLGRALSENDWDVIARGIGAWAGGSRFVGGGVYAGSTAEGLWDLFSHSPARWILGAGGFLIN